MIFDFSKEVKTATSERERKEAMIDRIIRPEVEEAIREAGLNPSYFMVNKASEQEFFKRPFTDTQEDGSFTSLYYDWITPDTLYRCECRIELSWDFLTVKSETDMYRMEHYSEGKPEWQYFNGEDWEEGPEEDFFPITDLELRWLQ